MAKLAIIGFKQGNLIRDEHGSNCFFYLNIDSECIFRSYFSIPAVPRKR